LTNAQVRQIHEASLQILNDPGLICFNERAAAIFREHGAGVTEVPGSASPTWLVKITENLVTDALASAPSTVTLGARNPANALVMNGDEPRVYWITGSETNTWLESDVAAYVRKDDASREVLLTEFTPRRGTVADLCASAHVCEHLDTVDGYIVPSISG
jgi:trimethylamine--corrinoid protein Co-methyltransferase